MRLFLVTVQRFTKKELIEIFDYLTKNKFKPIVWNGVHIVFEKECTAEEWCEIYNYLVEEYNW